MSDFGKQVSAAIDKALDAQSQTADEIARSAGITPKHLSRIRRGYNVGKPAVLNRIAIALGLRWQISLQPERHQYDHDGWCSLHNSYHRPSKGSG
jgi:transcriptional regulator with XRE-family HTH domain